MAAVGHFTLFRLSICCLISLALVLLRRAGLHLLLQLDFAPLNAPLTMQAVSRI